MHKRCASRTGSVDVKPRLQRGHKILIMIKIHYRQFARKATYTQAFKAVFTCDTVAKISIFGWIHET